MVTRNLALRTRRSRARRQRFEGKGARRVAVPSAAEVLEREAVRSRVVEAVLGLQEAHRSVVLLRYFEGLPPRDIATHLDLPVETVRTRLKRAFRARLDQEHEGDRRAWALPLVAFARPFELPAPPVGPPMGSETLMGATTMTMTKIAAGVGVVAVAAGLLWWNGNKDAEDGAASPPAEQAEVSEDPSPAAESARRRRSPAPRESGETSSTPEAASAAVQHVVRGAVVDDDGKPFAGAEVYVVGKRNPFGGEGRIGIDQLRGNVFETDAQGRFDVELPRGSRVFVGVRRSPEIQPPEKGGIWVDTPKEGIELRATRMPVATLVVRLVDPVSGAAQSNFRCTFRSQTIGLLTMGAKGNQIERVFRVTPDTPDSPVVVTLAEPRLDPAPFNEVHLQAGERIVVTLELPARGEFSGRVVDAQGNSVQDAFVYVGNQIRGRGDEWMKPMDPKRVSDGTRTDSDGSYTLKGEGRHVTAWHPDHGSVTVPFADAANVQLPGLGNLSVRILDIEGKPVANTEVTLDRKNEATTDDQGRVAWERVEPGVRFLQTPRPMRRLIAVRVRPGVSDEIEIGGWIPEVSGEVTANGAPVTERGGGLLLGLDDVFSLHEAGFRDGKFMTRRVLPGRYLFMSRNGNTSIIDMTGPQAAMDLGSSSLTVQAKAGTRVYVVPADPSFLVRLMGGRMSQTVPESGELLYSPFPEGKWAIGIDRQGIFRTVTVPAAGASVTLP